MYGVRCTLVPQSRGRNTIRKRGGQRGDSGVGWILCKVVYFNMVFRELVKMYSGSGSSGTVDAGEGKR